MSWNRFLKVVSICYVVFLTALLLDANPLRIIGVRGGAPWFIKDLMPVAHVLSFFLLALLILSVQWTLPRWMVAVLLVVYGGTTEMLQSFLPTRTAEWIDWLQDIAGVVVGVALAWVLHVAAVWLSSRAKPENTAPHSTDAQSTDALGIDRKGASQRNSREGSWWQS
jgi:VanZ family protein